MFQIQAFDLSNGIFVGQTWFKGHTEVDPGSSSIIISQIFVDCIQESKYLYQTVLACCFNLYTLPCEKILASETLK